MKTMLLESIPCLDHRVMIYYRSKIRNVLSHSRYKLMPTYSKYDMCLHVSATSDDTEGYQMLSFL